MTIRMRVLPRFPATILGANGIKIIREDGSVDLTVAPEFDALARVPSVSNPDTRFFMVWNEDDGSYAIMSFTDTFAAVIDTTGLMAASVYDPQGIEDDAFDRANHTGEQAISTVTGLQTALDAKLPLVDGVRYDAAQSNSASRQAQARANISAALSGHIFGLALSNNATDATNDIDIAAGETASTSATPVLMVVAAAMGKRIDAAWTVGGTPGATLGGLDTGAVADGTYGFFVMKRLDTGAVDCCFSLSATPTTGGNIPVEYTHFRRVGYVVRQGGVNLAFLHDGGDEFRVVGRPLGINAAVIGTSASTQTLVAGTVPNGAALTVNLAVTAGVASSVASVMISALDETDLAVDSTNGDVGVAGNGLTTAQANGNKAVRMNSSRQIRVRAAGASTTVNARVLSWIDRRGRL